MEENKYSQRKRSRDNLLEKSSILSLLDGNEEAFDLVSQKNQIGSSSPNDFHKKTITQSNKNHNVFVLENNFFLKEYENALNHIKLSSPDLYFNRNIERLKIKIGRTKLNLQKISNLLKSNKFNRSIEKKYRNPLQPKIKNLIFLLIIIVIGLVFFFLYKEYNLNEIYLSMNNKSLTLILVLIILVVLVSVIIINRNTQKKKHSINLLLADKILNKIEHELNTQNSNTILNFEAIIMKFCRENNLTKNYFEENIELEMINMIRSNDGNSSEFLLL